MTGSLDDTTGGTLDDAAQQLEVGNIDVTGNEPLHAASAVVFRDGSDTVAVDAQGVEISSGTDAFTVIQAAVDDNEPSGTEPFPDGGATTFIKQGDYTGSSSGIDVSSNQRLVGEGPATKLTYSGSGAAITTSNPSGHNWTRHVLLKDFQLVSDGSTGGGIETSSSEGRLLRSRLQGLIIRDFTSSGAEALDLHGAVTVVVESCHLENNDRNCNLRGSSTTIHFIDTRLRKAQGLFSIQMNGAVGVYFEQCIFEADTADSVNIISGCTNIKFDTCYWESNESVDVQVGGGGDVTNIKFVSCRAFNNKNSARSWVLDGTTGTPPVNVEFDGCLWKTGPDTPSSWIALDFQDGSGAEASVRDCRFLEDQSNTGMTAIDVDAGDTLFLDEQTTFSGWDTNINANGTVKGTNSGFVTENSGTATVASGTTSITVAHGLDVTPSAEDIQVTPTNDPTNDVGNFWVDTVGATNFNINVGADPGTGGATFSWSAEA